MKPFLVAAILVAWPAATAARALSLTRPGQPARCDRLDVTGEEMTCGRELCELRGSVHLACESLALWADEVDIALGPDQSFAGAVARGNVLLVERNTVLTCERITLAEDRVQGRVEAATFRIKRAPVKRDARGVPTGKDEVVFRGEFERHDARRLHVRDASFTMCDCGDDPPSWVLEADEIDATLGERATLWWPQPRFNAFGLGMVPGPPLLPMSLALGDRAAGMLPPEVKFLGGSLWPTIDIPVFVPLGRSWDLTISPGMRFDWGRQRLTPISAWGAPRLGGRVRYAPHRSTHGEVTISWTWDRQARAAWVYARDTAETTEGFPTTLRQLEALEEDEITSNVASLLGRRELIHRVSVELEHRTDFSDRLTWLVAAEWLSDDLMRSDFEVSLEELVANYVPSRTQLLWRSPGFAGTLGADAMLVLDNSAVPDASPPEFDYSNLGSREASVAHRGPDLRLALLPLRLGAGLHADAELSLVRFGPWTDARAPDRVVAGGLAGLSYLDRVGPVGLRASARLDALWVDPTAEDEQIAVAAIVDSSASLRLAKAAGSILHVVEPRLAYRGLPWLSEPIAGGPPLDPRFERGELHQLALELDQTWSRVRKKRSRPAARLVLRQPIDLETGELLQTQARLEARAGRLRLRSWVDVDLPGDLTVEEAGAYLSAGWRGFGISAEWARWTPRADRFRRTLYELGAAGASLDRAAWVHMVRAGARFARGPVSASYSADYLLPAEAIDCALDDNTPDRTQACRDAGQRVPGFARHAISLAYRSPCDCWEIGTSVSIPAADPSDFRAQVTVAVGGYRLGY